MARSRTKVREEILEKKRIAERLRYKKLKNDPIKLVDQKEKSRAKYLARREKGQRKLVSEMTDREKREARKRWRGYSKTHYDKKIAMEKNTEDFLRANTPSSLCDENVNPNLQQQVADAQILTPRAAVARERVLRQRKRRNRELQHKDKTIRELKAKLHKYRKRYHRLKEERKEQPPQELTPSTKMTKLAEDPDTRVEVVKKALFGEVLEKQLSKNMSNLKTTSEKRIANKILLGPIVEENKIWKTGNRIITYKKVWHSQKLNKINQRRLKTFKYAVQHFLEDDAIWAHLKPVMDELPADVENMHFLSDGPVTQYRNKLMFYMLACKIPDLCPNIVNWTWNYTEAGHGKGAPDGIGAVCKRTADNIVACGRDIADINEFCSAVQVFAVSDNEIDNMSLLISENQPNLVSFSGTLKVHQVQGNVFFTEKAYNEKSKLFLR
nr:unnamed protein product [Callosobruchus analis]